MRERTIVRREESLPEISVRESYRPRSARFLELWEPRDWIVKLYGIAYKGDVPPAERVEAAKEAAARVLPAPARAEDRYGIAVVTVHQGQDACWLLVDWWGYECVLHHRLLMSPLSGEGGFVRPPADVTACVWELPLLLFERDAWVRTVLTDHQRPDVARYLEQRFNGAI